jgi:hypothetical protein
LRILDAAHALGAALEAAVPGSEVALRGSLAAGAADRFSDINLSWLVDDLLTALDLLPAAAERALGPLLRCREDPDTVNSHAGRVVALRFRDLPLFWRVDLEIRARGAQDHGPIRPGALRDPAASAFENAVATVKMLGRGDVPAARGLLERGHARIGTRFAGTVDAAAALHLAEEAAARDETLRPLLERLAAATGWSWTG